MTPTEKFAITQVDITPNNHHRWGCPVYLLDKIFQDNISGVTRWENISRAGIYIGNSPFYAG